MDLSKNRPVVAEILGIKTSELDALRYIESEHRDARGVLDYYYLIFYDENPAAIMRRVQGLVGNTVHLPAWLFDDLTGQARME